MIGRTRSYVVLGLLAASGLAVAAYYYRGRAAAEAAPSPYVEALKREYARLEQERLRAFDAAAMPDEYTFLDDPGPEIAPTSATSYDLRNNPEVVAELQRIRAQFAESRILSGAKAENRVIELTEEMARLKETIAGTEALARKGR